MEMTFAEYFDYVHYPATLPVIAAGRETQRQRVVIVGGGPTGLALALGLANYGVPSVVIEADDTVCSGSRAGALTRRTLEIFERLGIADAAMEKGIAWSAGVTYYQDREVYGFQMPDDANQKYPPGMSLQQNYVEQYLLDAAEKRSDMIEIRWQSRVSAMQVLADGIELTIETPEASYVTTTDRVVACDGGRSTIRREMDLELHGTAYEGSYVIIDIRIDTDGFPIGRRCWFDPPSNPGSTLLMYTKPDNMVRFDYQLTADEDVEEAMLPENVLPRVERQLAMLGVDRPWEPVWMSLYQAKAVTLDSYVHDRVLFAGDAAHLVPIFGVRGMNSSLDDAHNLAWKLAFVDRGLAGTQLLASYSAERVHAARENLRLASKSAEFMAPPSAPFTLMRDAVLSLSERHTWITSLLNPRQHTAIPLRESPLNVADSEGWSAGPLPGDILLECPVTVRDADGQTRATHLTSLLGPHFTLLSFGEVAPDVAQACVLLEVGDVAFRSRVVADAPDPAGSVHALYGAEPGSSYLVRPDGHVLARWHDLTGEVLQSTLARTVGSAHQVEGDRS